LTLFFFFDNPGAPHLGRVPGVFFSSATALPTQPPFLAVTVLFETANLSTVSWSFLFGLLFLTEEDPQPFSFRLLRKTATPFFLPRVFFKNVASRGPSKPFLLSPPTTVPRPGLVSEFFLAVWACQRRAAFLPPCPGFLVPFELVIFPQCPLPWGFDKTFGPFFPANLVTHPSSFSRAIFSLIFWSGFFSFWTFQPHPRWPALGVFGRPSFLPVFFSFCPGQTFAAPTGPVALPGI